jgi:hypothetical protein
MIWTGCLKILTLEFTVLNKAAIKFFRKFKKLSDIGTEHRRAVLAVKELNQRSRMLRRR